MFKNYLQTAFRNLYKHKLYSFINIAGLTVGLLSCMVVATVVIDDLSYDKQWSRSNDLYRIVTVNKMGEGVFDRFASSFAGLAPELKKSFPEVEASATLSPSELRLKLTEDNNGLKVASLRADTDFWQLLDVKIVAGNPKHFVAGNTNLIISESFKNKFYKDVNPIGKLVYDVPSYSDKPQAYIITGVIKDLPSNTHLRADVIEVRGGMVEALSKEQYGTFTKNYLLLKPGTDIQKFTSKVNKWYKGFITAGKPYLYEFQPIKDVYLHSDFEPYQQVKGDIKNIYIFSGVALLLLLIACVNFINLSTARAATRLRETGIRKVLGASRKQIMAQFLAEALLFFSVSAILAFIGYQFSLQPVQTFLGHSIQQTFFSRISLFAPVLIFVLFVSVFTGIYPAWLLSGFKPSNTLKGKLSASNSFGQNWLRKSLVVLQFSISIVVLIAMIVVQQQLNFMKNADIGFNKNNLLSIASVSWDGKGDAFKNELLKMPGVLSASQTTWLPANGGGYMSRDIDDPNHSGNKITVWFISGDLDFTRTMGLQLNKGRFLSTQFSTDVMNEDSLQQLGETEYNKASESRHCIVTATTANLLHINKLDQPLLSVKTVPVGIVADFHTLSFHENIGPTIILAERSLQYGSMLIRVAPNADKQVTAGVQKLWRQFYPAKLLETNWVDDLLTKQYEAESKLQQLFAFFSALTMALAALGIFGLIVHAAQQRTKEIGVRKVLGASVTSIAQLLSFSFVKLVLVAILVASPIAWYFLNKWLQDFAYRVTISWWMFALAGFIAVLIAVITVSFQAIKAAIANPVKSLRSE